MNALDLIRGFEGYRATPYWDVNAYRTGYGSDTITAPDGSVVRVAPGMTTTRADAERDLSRRVNTEFAPIAARAVGASVWGGLSEPQKAALTSIAYNYGRIPESVSSAFSGGPEAVAEAIRALGSHNDGINAGRRSKEADVFLSGGSAADDATTRPAETAPTPERNALQAAQLDPRAFMAPTNALQPVPLMAARRNALGRL